MHRSAKHAAALGVAIAAFLGSQSATAALVSYTSDADFLANAQFTKSFGANARWGNNPAASGDWEYAVVDAADTPIGTPGQVLWNDHTIHNAVFTYDGATGHFVLCDVSVFADTGAQPVTGGAGINALAFRGRAGGDDMAILDSIMVTFDVDGATVSVGGLLGDADADYVMLIDSRLAGGFQVSMLAALSDEGVPTTAGSIPMYGLKAGSTTVPVPAAAWLFGSALGLLGWARRRARDRFSAGEIAPR